MPTLTISHNNRLIELQLPKDIDFGRLSWEVAEAAKVNQRSMILRRGLSDILAKPDARLSTLNIHRGDTLTVVEGMVVHLFLRRAVDAVDQPHPDAALQLPSWDIAVRPEDTIADLKLRIERQVGIPVGSQWLTTEKGATPEDTALAAKHRGYVLMPSNPDAILLNITHNFDPEQTMEVSRFASAHDSVNLLVKKVADDFPHIDPNHVSVTHNCRPVDSRQSWAGAGVPKVADVEFFFKAPPAALVDDMPLNVVVRTAQGKCIAITATTRMHVWKMKELVSNSVGISPGQMKLIVAGTQLENSRQLFEYGIVDGCIMHLVLRISAGMYTEWSGRADFTVAPPLSFEENFKEMPQGSVLAASAPWKKEVFNTPEALDDAVESDFE